MKVMNSHPVDYPSLIACMVMFLFNALAHLHIPTVPIHAAFQFMEYASAVIGFILTVSRFVDWVKAKFFNHKK